MAKINLLKETEELHKLENIKWASVQHPYGHFLLKPTHCFDKNSLEKFKEFLNIQYDNDWGTQYVFGLIVFKDGSWLERQEYDGSEWWELKSEPQYKSEYAKEIGDKRIYNDSDEERNWQLTNTDGYVVFEMPKK